LWRGMSEMGWMGTAIPEQYGGAGFGHLELCVIAEELGRSLAPTPFASTIYLAAEALLLAGSDAQKKRWLPRIAQGEAIGCLALAEGAQVATPAHLSTPAEGAVLVAFEQLGGAQAALEMAREYALGRFAFGRQIASFQAIKHKLADMYVGVELARSNAYYGAWALTKDAPELPVAAAAARVAAS